MIIKYKFFDWLIDLMKELLLSVAENDIECIKESLVYSKKKFNIENYTFLLKKKIYSISFCAGVDVFLHIYMYNLRYNPYK